MKVLILLITVFSMAAWSQEEPLNRSDVNLKIGLSSNDKETEGTVNNRYHSAAETSMTGGTRATCPDCGDPSQLPDSTAFKGKSGATTDGTGSDGQQ